MRWDGGSPETDPLILGMAVVFVFLAAIVRGYSGFGFSLLAITALSLILPPASVVPSLFMLEIAASLHLLPAVWQNVHWRSIGPLLLGCLIGTPVGVWLLSTVPAASMQVALGMVMMVSTFLLWKGFGLKTMPGRAASVGTGAVSGLLNGAFSTAGPPVIILYFSSPAGAAAGRASLIAYFLGTDLIAMPLVAQAGLLTPETVVRALIFLPALLLGIWIGARSFSSADPVTFRKWVLAILAFLSLLTMTQGAATLLSK